MLFGEEAMKRVSPNNIAVRLIAWINSYRDVNNVYPRTLDELIENIPGNRDYDPRSLLNLYTQMGYIIHCNFFEKSFVIEIFFNNKKLIYNSETNIFLTEDVEA
jgi:hypothetical protein